MDSKALTKIFDLSPAASLLLLPDAPHFTIVGANQAYLKATAAQKDNLIGKGIFEAFPNNPDYPISDGGSILRDSLLSTIATKEPHKMVAQKYDTLIRGTDKYEMKYWDTENIPVLDDEGQINYIIHAVQDVTEEIILKDNRSNLLNELKQRNSFIESILQKLPIGIGVSKIDTGEASIINKQFNEIYGLGENDINSVSDFFEKVYPDKIYRDEIRERISADIRSGNPEQMRWDNITITTQTGEKRIVNAQNIPLKEYNLMVSTVVDVTQMASNAAELQKTKVNQEALINGTEDFLWSIDTDYHIIAFNKAYKNSIFIDTGKVLKVGDYVLIDAYGEDLVNLWRGYYDRAILGEVFTVETRAFNKQKHSIEFRETSFKPIYQPSGEVLGVACYSKNTTETRYYLELEKLERDILEINTQGNQNRVDVISQYMVGIETLHPGMLCSMQEVRGNRLFNLSSPNLPKDYLDYIAGVEVGDNVGSCATSVYLKENVIVSDIATDVRWVDYKDAALKNNLRACWSHPIVDAEGNVIATFAAYYNEIKQPTYFEENTIKRAGHILKILLEGYRKEDALQDSIKRYEYVTKATFDAIWDWDATTNSIYLGEGFKELFGELDIATLTLSERHNKRIHPDDYNEVVTSAIEAIKGKDTKWNCNFRFLKADGDYAFVHNRAVLLKDAKGSTTRVIGAMQDITKQKEEEHRLKLMESLIANTNDAVVIAEVGKLKGEAPAITYVNEAFANLTGYKAEDVIGKTPLILHGPNSDWEELNRLWGAMENSESCIVNIISYKKNGDQFWTNLSVSPVTDEDGLVTHWIHIGRDISERKQQESQKNLLSSIALKFNEDKNLNQTLVSIIDQIADYGGFSLAEIWLLDTNKKTINLSAFSTTSEARRQFYDESSDFVSFKIGEGLPGICWQDETAILLKDVDIDPNFKRFKAANKADLKSAYALPIQHNTDFIGTLVLGFDRDLEKDCNCTALLDNLGSQLGSKIKRKQLEQELSQIFALSRDIICIVNLNGCFTKINPAMCHILEYTEAELLSSPFMQFVHSDDISKSEAEFKSILNGKTTVNFENRYVTKSGKIVWLAWSVSPSTEDGVLFGIARDITEKKELEDLLSKANTLAKIGGWEYDVLNDKLYWSEITREIAEVEPDYEQTLEKTILLYKEGKDRELIAKHAEAALEFGSSFDLEVQIVTAKGNEKWVRVISESKLVNGKCVRTYGSFQDIDERKRIELSLIKALEEKETILESIGDAFFAVDHNWTVTYWNKQAEILLGRPKEEIIGKNGWEVYTDVVDTTFYHYYQKAMEERSVQHFEAFYDTVGAWYEVSAYPSDNGLSVYFKDITQRKISQIQLNELNENIHKHSKELAKSNADLEQFAYVASHDLQEPLRMVTSFLTQLDKKYGDVIDEKGKKYIYFAVDGAKRMRQIILDLLEFSRVGKAEDPSECIDLNELIKEIQILYLKQIEEKSAVFCVDDLPMLQGNKSAIRQVYQNLISNALKYSDSITPPKINISAKDYKDHWQFSVSDNGIGIEEEYYDRIFVIFQRLHSNSEFSGTGMGLAVTKKIIENLEGSIWVDSKVGEGSTFNFTIPKAKG